MVSIQKCLSTLNIPSGNIKRTLVVALAGLVSVILLVTAAVNSWSLSSHEREKALALYAAFWLPWYAVHLSLLLVQGQEPSSGL